MRFSGKVCKMGVFLGFFPLRPENGLIRGKMDRVGRIPPRQHPPASADAPHMCEQKTVDGRRKIIRKTGQKWPKWKEQAQGWPNFASGSLRGRPTHMWKGVDDGNTEITRKKRPKNGLNGRNRGGIGQILVPPAFVSSCKRPTHVWAGDGKRKIIRKAEQ